MTLSRSTLLLACVAMLAVPALAQERDATIPRVSPNASTAIQLGVTQIKAHYGAPSVRDRTIFGELVPYGEAWRTGANEATTVSFSTDVRVEGQELDAGTYMLATIPGQDSWTVIFNSQAEQWGTYQYDPAHDVLRVTVSPRAAPARETMAISFDNVDATGQTDGVDLIIHWADVAVPVRITTDTQRHVELRGDAAIESDDPRLPLTFARYALQSGHHMDKALAWVDAAILHEESYSALALRARILAAQGDEAAAAETAERALALAEAMDQPPPGAADLRRQAAEWRDGG